MGLHTSCLPMEPIFINMSGFFLIICGHYGLGKRYNSPCINVQHCRPSLPDSFLEETETMGIPRILIRISNIGEFRCRESKCFKKPPFLSCTSKSTKVKNFWLCLDSSFFMLHPIAFFSPPRITILILLEAKIFAVCKPSTTKLRQLLNAVYHCVVLFIKKLVSKLLFLIIR